MSVEKAVAPSEAAKLRKTSRYSARLGSAARTCSLNTSPPTRRGLPKQSRACTSIVVGRPATESYRLAPLAVQAFAATGPAVKPGRKGEPRMGIPFTVTWSFCRASTDLGTYVHANVPSVLSRVKASTVTSLPTMRRATTTSPPIRRRSLYGSSDSTVNDVAHPTSAAVSPGPYALAEVVESGSGVFGTNAGVGGTPRRWLGYMAARGATRCPYASAG